MKMHNINCSKTAQEAHVALRGGDGNAKYSCYGYTCFCVLEAMSIVDLKTETAVINQKVSENHKMLTVLWDDFLEKKMAISRGSLANQI